MITVKYRVDWIESERGWGTKIDDTEYFDTEQEASAVVARANVGQDFGGPVPDYYYIAQYVGPVVYDTEAGKEVRNSL